MSWKHHLVGGRMVLCFCVMCSFFLAGCRAETPTSDKQTEIKKEALPSHARFIPTGSSPEVALDTDTGTLCRTVPVQPSQRETYANLPLCTTIPESNAPPFRRVTIDSSLWEKGEADASCSRDKGSITFYPADHPGKKLVTADCTIRNHSDRNVRLDARPPKFDAVFRLQDGSTVRPNEEIYLASSKTEIPAHGDIVGGLWVSHTCDAAVPNVDCLQAGLMNAKELLLTDLNTGIHYCVRIDRP